MKHSRRTARFLFKKANIEELEMHILTCVTNIQTHKVGKQCASVAAMSLCTLCESENVFCDCFDHVPHLKV